jgi:hypothetical protein
MDAPSAGTYSALRAVTARSGSDAWASGGSTDSVGINRTLIEHWDGQSWTVVPSQDPGAAASTLLGMASAGSRIWAVGAYEDDFENHARTLVESPCP